MCRSVLESVRELAPSIAERADEIEAARRLPDDLHKQLRRSGLYRLLVPRSHGGEPVSRLQILEIIETLARADGSVGWTATLGLQTPCLLALLPRETFDAIYADGPDVTMGGASGPQGKSRAVEGGYSVSGKWAFASGCDNWDYLFANSMVVDGGDSPRTAGGPAQARAMLVPRSRAEIVDTWHTLGLRGTGSKHFALDEIFVAEAYSFDLLWGRPCLETLYRYPFIEFAHHLATVAIGIAQGALDELIGSASERRRVFSRASIAATPTVQQHIGRCETALRAARQLMRSQAEQPMAEADEADLISQLLQRWSANAWAIEVCLDVVQTCFRVHGGPSVYDGSPLHRRLRDIHTISQHTAFNEVSLTRHGAILLGQEVAPWF